MAEKIKNNFKIKRAVLICVFSALFIISLFVGVLEMNVKKILAFDKEAWRLLLISRGPRNIAIVLTASSLTVAGLIMQTVSRNKFISPSTVGTTQAAQLALLIAVLFLDIKSLGLKLVFCFIFAFGSSLIFNAMLKKIKFNNVIYVPLLGIMYGAIIYAVTYFIAYNTGTLQLLDSFAVGSFSLMISGRFEILYVLLVPLVLAAIYSSVFNIVGMGKSFSKNLGVNYNVYMSLGLAISSLISAVTYVIIGPIAFLGLVIPNLISLYYGDNIKKSIFDMMLAGSSFLLLSDIIARIIAAPYELPVSLITGILGSLIFLILILRKAGK